MKSYAVIFAPEFRLQAPLRHSSKRADKPVALLEMEGTKPLIGEINVLARNRQVELGMTPTQAMARCPDLLLIHKNEGSERCAQESMLQIAASLSPFLESTSPGVVTIELPPERVFCQDDLKKKIITPLRSLGLEVRIGLAGSPDLALLAARCPHSVTIVTDAAEFLAPLPLSSLPREAELARILDSWGIHTIGQLVALPCAQVWERLGPEAVQLWERANGGRPRPLLLVKPSEVFSEASDFESPVEMLQPLLFLLRRFLEEITARLAAVYLAADRLQLLLRFDNGTTYERFFTLPKPTRDVNLLFRVLHAHLENFTSESSIIGLELTARPVRPRSEQVELLDRGLRDPHQFAETLARLQALLGSDQVGSPELELSRHPDAFHIRSYDPDASAPAETQDKLIDIPWLRFNPPVPAQVSLDDVGPAYLSCACGTGPIREVRGPWVLEGQWWEKRRWSRQEWDIATDGGFYRLVCTQDNWFLDGIYV